MPVFLPNRISAKPCSLRFGLGCLFGVVCCVCGFEACPLGTLNPNWNLLQIGKGHKSREKKNQRKNQFYQQQNYSVTKFTRELVAKEGFKLFSTFSKFSEPCAWSVRPLPVARVSESARTHLSTF